MAINKLIDTTLLKEFKSKQDQYNENTYEKKGTGSAIIIDTTMSDTSTNPVQNKVIKDYVDNKAVTVSSTSGNAIETKTDGIYVKKTAVSTDSDNALSEKSNGLYVKDLSGAVNSINIAQKTVNKGLDSCFMQLAENYTPVVGEYVPFARISGSMDVANGRVVVKAGQRVQIDISIGYGSTADVAANIYYEIKDYTNDKLIHIIQPHREQNEYEYPFSTVCQYTNDTSAPCEIGLYVSGIYLNDTMSSLISAMTVHEIGRAVTIDPLEYANETSGIEDTPVGHIIAHMGTNAPKHYLACDGSSVAVADYPYLAQHFKDEFGSEYYFGGSDGTMQLPDLRGEFLRGTGTNSHENQGNGGEVGEHQDATILPKIGGKEGALLWTPTTDDATAWIQNADTDIHNESYSGLGKYVNKTGTWESPTASIGNTTRPTNTSVLYCIKYEPTYFMQNTYNGSVYSTDEQIVGKWIDGKPIYQKTFTYGALSASTSWQKLEDFPNVDTVVDAKHIFTLASGFVQSSDGVLAGTTSRFQIVYKNGEIIYYAGTALTGTDAVTGAHFTIQYTKTTD